MKKPLCVSDCPAFFRLVPNRVWRSYLGGRTLDEIAGVANPSDTHFPEDWLLSTTAARNVGREDSPDEGISKTESVAGALSLIEVIDSWPEEIFGAGHLECFGRSAGFLLKYLDSAIRLHIQCHPSIKFAGKHLNSRFGKTEGYYILGVRPGCEGYVYLGFQRAPERSEFKRAIEEQDERALLSYFEKIPVRPGDCFYVPGGIPHAIGEGVFMIEMMEPTDFAVRIEFERGGYVLPESARFMNRGIDFALDMFDYTGRDAAETRKAFFIEPCKLPLAGDGERFSLFDSRSTECFRAERINVHGRITEHKESAAVLVVVSGSGVLRVDGIECALAPYDRVLLPYRSGTFEVEGEMEIFLAMPPLPG